MLLKKNSAVAGGNVVEIVMRQPGAAVMSHTFLSLYNIVHLHGTLVTRNEGQRGVPEHLCRGASRRVHAALWLQL